jgi:prepilin-type N-terminal cleavage/methylation domain-containing protein
MDSDIKHTAGGIPRPGQSCPGGHTLVEVITVVMILSILACVAVPRLNFAAVVGARADAAVRQIATDLRRTRANAILHAAANPTGFALVMSGGGPYDGYQIIDLHDSSVVAACEIPDGVRCSGGQRFEFGPLGNLRSGSDTELRITTEARTYLVEIAPATGAVKWTRHD